jgi:flagella basal body P-ring formation protein FlgA
VCIAAALFFSLAAQPGLAQMAPSQQNAGLFTGKDAEAVIADALVKAGAGEDIKVSISEARGDDVITSAAGIVSAETDGLEIDKAHSRWQAILLLRADGKNLAPIRLSGRYDEMMAVPILKRRIQANEVIGEEDIDWDKQPISRLRRNIVTNPQEIIGKSPRHVISQGRPIRTDEIASPTVVSKGMQVTLFYRSQNIEIKTFGEALDAGAVGDVVRVRNTASKAVIQGTVESGDRVRVTSPDMSSAEAM